ncbi:serine hydrolase domain-containing protein [Sphingomonas azotifigens]|uniref:serine hydrolase domain-containing protein n=1 Tax=Sphingomonas azotifigens TaxID=330920 RepID=UPI000A00074C|nr:serine hydrolase domain-containing protein [Sphingomonas azotifigens]
MTAKRVFGLIGAMALLQAPMVQAQTAPSQVQTFARETVASGKVPGIVVTYAKGQAPMTVVTEGRMAYEATAPKVNVDTLWRVYSMTKPITGMAAMILIEEGKLKLDQPISDFIPAFKDMKVLIDPNKDLTSRPATRPITVRNLLTHTAGLGYNIITKGPLLNEYNRLGINPAQVSDSFEATARPVRPATLEEFANRTATLPLIAEPGAKFSYSIGLDVLGRVIEVASGMPFDTFVNTRILQPLKMTSSYWTVPAGEAGRLATEYATTGTNRFPIDPGATSVYLKKPSFPYGGAGLAMSARDYDRFLHMLQNGGELDGVRILKPETVALAMSDLLPPGVDKTMLAVMARDTGVPMGFGAGGSVFLADQPNGAGKGTFGWSGAAGTFSWVDPKNQVRATMMVNILLAELGLKVPVRAAVYADLNK